MDNIAVALEGGYFDAGQIEDLLYRNFPNSDLDLLDAFLVYLHQKVESGKLFVEMFKE